MMASDHVLRYRLGKGDWQEFRLTSDDVLIGRGEECDLTLNRREVSRQHARLRRMGNEFQITDLGSSNGTELDGKLLLSQYPVALQPGQKITIGDFSLTLEASAQASTYVADEPLHIEGDSYQLRYRLTDGPWQEVSLSLGEYILGRGEDADVCLDNSEVSRQHTQLNVDVDDLWLMDLGSTNGTKIEADLIDTGMKYRLNPGQTFRIGPFELIVESLISPEAKPSGVLTNLVPGVPAVEAGSAKMIGTIVSEDVFEEPTMVRTMNLMQQDKVSIGRAADNHMVLNHPLISRYHAAIDRMGTRFRLRDLRSTNGVFVNGKRIEREVFLKDWDQIRIGPYIFVMSGQNLQAHAAEGLTIEARSLNQRVTPQLNLLKDISLVIKPMEFVALVGMSGSGKTTFLNAISGYRPASHGQVLVDGINLYEHYDLFRNDIGYVPQKDIVHAELTPEVALEYVARLRMPPDTTASERMAVVNEVLEDLDLTERRNVPISRLSGGQLKRVSIGVELLTKPRLFFLDEPTSGLDPGTEYDMMKLMRRLADQGRTVMLVTHATKNVMLCDKVIFLARGGYLAYFGAPEDALAYFDNHRTDRERREKEMEFDDIYRILDDESRGAPKAWGDRYRKSQDYQAVLGSTGTIQPATAAPAPRAVKVQSTQTRVSSFRQFMILSSRNLKILSQDKVSLGLMLALAPMIGLMDFMWGRDIFDPVEGDASKIITMWFMMALITILIGALSSVREIVKEDDIYKRERAVNLKIPPYIFSKVWVGFVLAIYQAGVLLFFRMVFVKLELPSGGAFFSVYMTLFIGTLCGYLVGLAISASAPNQNAAMMLIIVVLVPQFLFAGALLPLDLIPGGESISLVMPTRWAFEAFIRVSGLGQELIDDPCWSSFPKVDRLRLPEALKSDCPCMGESIFTQCADFPGVLSPDYYDEEAQAALGMPKPEEPPQPTAYPYPTAYPSPTSLPTPTLLPSLTPNPTPANPADMPDYMDLQQEQGNIYQDAILDQFEEYRLDSQAQGDVYSEVRTEQGDEYSELRQQQGDEYSDAMQLYGDERSEWQESREKAISSAEGMLGSIYDNYQQTFQGTVVGRWVNLTLIMAALLVFVLVFQKRKDVV
jgi:ABC-type multidrug transport system ATPase subunit/pSer/pThr/pTyr-binding forkhead associated (FHA) protein